MKRQSATWRAGYESSPARWAALRQAATRIEWGRTRQRLDCSVEITALLANGKIAKAGVSLADDLKKLKQLFAFEEAGVADLGIAAKRRGIKQTGVRNLAGKFLGIRIPKGNSTSNWAAPRLTPQQIAYAATDAWACRELFLCFQKMGFV